MLAWSSGCSIIHDAMSAYVPLSNVFIPPTCCPSLESIAWCYYWWYRLGLPFLDSWKKSYRNMWIEIMQHLWTQAPVRAIILVRSHWRLFHIYQGLNSASLLSFAGVIVMVLLLMIPPECTFPGLLTGELSEYMNWNNAAFVEPSTSACNSFSPKSLKLVSHIRGL